MHDDWQLLRAYVETGSPSAFTELVTRYADLVYGCGLRQTGDAHAAEDVSQAVFMVLARKAKSIRAETPLGGWLFNVARYTASNYRRVEARRQRREQEAAAMNPTLSEPAKQSPVAAVLDDAVAALSRKERDAIVLRFYHEKSVREVGEALGISEDAAAQRISRALVHLRQRLEKIGTNIGDAGLVALLPLEFSRGAPQGFAVILAKTALLSGSGSAVSVALSQKVLRRLAWEKIKLAVAVLGMGTAVCAAAVGYHVLPNFRQVAPASPVINVSISRTWNHVGSAIVASALSPDGHRALTGGGDNFFPATGTEILLWDVDSATVVKKLLGHKGRVVGVSFAVDGQHAVSVSDDGTARIWDLNSGKQVNQLDAHLPITSLSVSPDGRFAAIGTRRLAGPEYVSIADANAPRLRLWDLQSRDDLHQFDNLMQGVGHVVFSPDGKRLALALDVRQVAIWEIGAARPTATMSVRSPFIDAMTFSPDGTRLLAAGSDGELYVWGGANGVLQSRWRMQKGLVRAVAMSNDGQILYTVGGTAVVRSPRVTEWNDCLLYAWDARNGKELGHFSGHSTGIWSMNMSADGRKLLTAGGQRISLWDIGREPIAP